MTAHPKKQAGTFRPPKNPQQAIREIRTFISRAEKNARNDNDKDTLQQASNARKYIKFIEQHLALMDATRKDAPQITRELSKEPVAPETGYSSDHNL